MKTSSALTLLSTLCFAAMTSSTVHAGSFGYSSKLANAPTHSRTIAMVDEGHFTWMAPDASVNRIVVSLADQSLYAYNGQKLVAYSNISSGKPGHETPTGDFTVSEKDPDHHSSIYENASMPFFMRLTDGGVGLHAGFIPGYPASHGCVRLPYGMAQELFQHVESGTPVEITSDAITLSQAGNAAPVASIHLAQN
jgi:lipoprotein-anchoring transpeptidase ErfK/SrfK